MQQLNTQSILQAAQRQNDVIVLAMPLPATPARTQQFIGQLGEALNVEPHQPDWGADRAQVIYTSEDIRFLLCIEWLCDAIWLEPAGGLQNDTDDLWYWLQQQQPNVLPSY